jgi:hypothetical protein
MFSRVSVPCVNSWKVNVQEWIQNASNGCIIRKILSPVQKFFVQEERQTKETTSFMNLNSHDEQIGKWVGF